MEVLMITCSRNHIPYPNVRKAMCQGARTIEDLKEMAGVCGQCDSCREKLPYILETLCGCKEVKMDTVIKLVEAGVKDLDQIMEETGAGTGQDCGRCQALIENIIELGY